MPQDAYFTDDSMLRIVHREFAVALSGQRALLMQACHPVAFVGLFAHSTGFDDPYGRLSRTAQVMDTIAFGPKEKADRLTRRVRAMHKKTRGVTDVQAGRFPPGTPYAADDPELLLWILSTLVDSALLVYQRYVRRLSRDERDAYWQDYKVVGELFGLERRHMPETIEDFDAYMRGMLEGDDLFITDQARELAIRIVLQPPVPLAARPLLELANQITVGLLPPDLRRGFGLSWDPVRGLAARAGAEYLKRAVVPVLPGKLRYAPSARAAATAA